MSALPACSSPNVPTNKTSLTLWESIQAKIAVAFLWRLVTLYQSTAFRMARFDQRETNVASTPQFTINSQLPGQAPALTAYLSPTQHSEPTI